MEYYLPTIGFFAYAVETLGVIVILGGVFHALRIVMRHRRALSQADLFTEFRREFARIMLVGLEFLVAGDIIRTVVVSHTLTDARREGGSVTVTIAMLGDPGLQASFDIAPGIADRIAMTETAAGSYSGEFTFPPETVGGPFTILGRVFHEKADEVVRRDPESVTIPLLADTY